MVKVQHVCSYTPFYFCSSLTEVNKTQVIVERNMTRVCGAIYFTTAVEAGELKEFSLYLSKGDEDLYSKILLSDVRRKILICDEIGKRQLCNYKSCLPTTKIA